MRKHHAYLREELPKLGGVFEKMLRAHGARHGATLQPIQAAFDERRDELQMHLLKEEQVLFPRAIALEDSLDRKRESESGMSSEG